MSNEHSMVLCKQKQSMQPKICRLTEMGEIDFST
jgi:hypothetical protein